MKRRLSASIDDELLAAAEHAVRDGRAPSMSALMEEALRRQLEHTKRLAAMDELVAWMDEEHGTQSEEETRRIVREWRAEAIRPNTPASRDAA